MRDLLDAAAAHAARYLESLPERPVDAALDPLSARNAPGFEDVDRPLAAMLREIESASREHAVG